MQLVTIQWLATNHAVFHPQLISQTILEKVIRQHVHKVELSHLADINDPKMVYPRTSKLYTKKEPSDKFILILEGRAIVTIGQVWIFYVKYFFEKSSFDYFFKILKT